MRKLLLLLALASSSLYAQVTTNSSVSGVTTATAARTDTSNTFTGTQTISGSASSLLYLYTTNANSSARNWAVGSNVNVFGDFAILKSTLIGGDPFSAGSTPFYISKAGRTLLNSTTDDLANQLQVNGDTKVTGAFAATGALTLAGLASSSAPTTGTMCWTTGTGNVNVDTTVACLSSTIRVKQAVKPLDTGLAAVMRMRPVSYDLKPQFNPEHLGRQVGLIAEEVGSIDPRLIALDDKGLPRGVRYMQLTAVLVKAIQQQQAQIKVLQDQINHSKHSNHPSPRKTP